MRKALDRGTGLPTVRLPFGGLPSKDLGEAATEEGGAPSSEGLANEDVEAWLVADAGRVAVSEEVIEEGGTLAVVEDGPAATFAISTGV